MDGMWNERAAHAHEILKRQGESASETSMRSYHRGLRKYRAETLPSVLVAISSAEPPP